ncbi:MAG: hypothetical protein ACP5OU_00885 [Methanothrix sp.]
MSKTANATNMAILAALLVCVACPVHAQYDPLASSLFTSPQDARRTSSIDGEKVQVDPNADPLGIDALMRPLDTQHSAEYLEIVSGQRNLSPAVAADLQSNWTLDLSGGTAGTAYLQLVQNREAVFGRGTLSTTLNSVSTFKAISASGYVTRDVLHLDLLDTHDLILYRCILTLSQDSLLGSFIAYDAWGRTWSGTAQARRAI